MASVGVQKCLKLSVNEIDTLLGSKQKNLDLMGNRFCATFFILETMIFGWNMTFLRNSPSNFSTIYAILSSFGGIYILLNRKFYQLHHNIQYINILMAMLQCTILLDSIRFMIIVAINTIRFMLLFIYVMYNSNDCKIFGYVISEIFLNYVISMDNIIFRRRINYLTLINVHFYFYMHRNGAQAEDYAIDDLNLDLDGLCIDYYNVANANWIILYKCLHLYILFCVNNYHLNVCGNSISISQTGGIIIMIAIVAVQYIGLFCLIRIVLLIIIVLLMVFSSINKFKESDIFDMVNSYRIVKYVSCNYPTNCNYLPLIIVFGITIVVIFNINTLDNALKFQQKQHVYNYLQY